MRFTAGMIHEYKLCVKLSAEKAAGTRLQVPAANVTGGINQPWADHCPCKLQSSRAVTEDAVMQKNASAASPGLRN